MQGIDTQTPYYNSLSDEQLQAALADKLAKSSLKRIELERLQAELMTLGQEVRALAEVRDSRRLAADKPRDWAALLAVPDFETRAHHEALKAALAQGLPAGCPSFAISADTVFAEEPQQHAVQIGLVYGHPMLTRAVTEKLREVLPHVRLVTPRPVRNDDLRPYKCVRVFESTCSASGIHFLAINEELGLYEMRKSSLGFERCLARAKDLEELLRAVETHWFYQNMADYQGTGQDFAEA